MDWRQERGSPASSTHAATIPRISTVLLHVVAFITNISLNLVIPTLRQVLAGCVRITGEPAGPAPGHCERTAHLGNRHCLVGGGKGESSVQYRPPTLQASLWPHPGSLIARSLVPESMGRGVSVEMRSVRYLFILQLKEGEKLQNPLGMTQDKRYNTCN